MIFSIYIKSHCESPDFEQEVEAENEEEAINKFYEILEGEFDRIFIMDHMLNE